MVVITNAAIFIALGLVVWVLAYLTGYKAVGVIGAVLVLGVGLAMLSGGVTYKVGETQTTVDADTTEVSNQYAQVSTPQELSLGFVVSILGGLCVLHAFNDIGPT